MNEFRFRPKSDYLQTTTLESLYALSEHWVSNMAFYRDEIAFLQSLFDKYFVLMTREDKVELVRTEANQLLGLTGKCDELTRKVRKHLVHLEELMDNAFSHDEQAFRNEHEHLEDEISDFVKRFREVKKNVFTLSEEAMEFGRLEHLLTK